MADQIVIYNPAQQMFLFVSDVDYNGQKLVEARSDVDERSLFEVQSDGRNPVAFFNAATNLRLSLSSDDLNGDPVIQGVPPSDSFAQKFDIVPSPFRNAMEIFGNTSAHLFVSNDVMGSNVVEAHHINGDDRDAFLLFKVTTLDLTLPLAEPITATLYAPERTKVLYISDDTEDDLNVAMGRDLTSYDDLYDYQISNFRGAPGFFTFSANGLFLRASDISVRGVSNIIVAGTSGTINEASFRLFEDSMPQTFVVVSGHGAVFVTETGYHIVGGNDELVSVGTPQKFMLLQRYDPPL